MLIGRQCSKDEEIKTACRGRYEENFLEVCETLANVRHCVQIRTYADQNLNKKAHPDWVDYCNCFDHFLSKQPFEPVSNRRVRNTEFGAELCER